MRKFKVTVDGQGFSVTVEEISGGIPAPAVKEDESRLAAPAAATDAAPAAVAVPSPMPGSIIDVPVDVGDTVAEGDVVVILEAMKMENEVTSPVAGTVIQVSVKIGDTVNSGDPLVIIG